MRVIGIIIVILLTLASCQKKKDDSIETLLSSGSASVTSPAPFYGVLLNKRFMTYVNHVPGLIFGRSEAYFCDSVFTNEDWPNPVYDAGEVSLNGMIFRKVSVGAPSVLYEDSTYALFSPPFIWRVSGAGPTPSIYFQNNDDFPVYNGISDFPDTIHKTGSFTFTFNNYSDIDEVTMVIDGMRRTVNLSVSNTIMYDSMAICNIPANQGTVAFYLKKDKYIMVQGKVYRMENVLEIHKSPVKYVNF